MTVRRQIPDQLVLPLVAGLSRKSRASLVRRIKVGWQDEANCAGYLDHDDFYQDGMASRHTNPKDICAFCPVVRSCLAAALVTDEQGIWGRTTEAERDSIREDLAHGTDIDHALSPFLDGPSATWGIAA